MSKQEQHWEKSKGLLMMTLAIWFVFSIGIFLFGAEMNEVTGPFGYPLTYWFTCHDKWTNKSTDNQMAP